MSAWAYSDGHTRRNRSRTKAGDQMVSTGPGGSTGPPASAPGESVALAIVEAAERASRGILDATERAVKSIMEAASAVPTALATPPNQTLDAETLAGIIEKYQSNGNSEYGMPMVGGMPYEYGIDQLVDDQGNSIAPDWMQPGSQQVEIPDPGRETVDVVRPGTPLVPGIPRLDLP